MLTDTCLRDFLDYTFDRNRTEVNIHFTFIGEMSSECMSAMQRVGRGWGKVEGQDFNDLA